MKLYTEFEKEISRRFDNPLYILQHSTGISTILKVEMTSDNAVFQNKGEIRIREREQEINK